MRMDLLGLLPLAYLICRTSWLQNKGGEDRVTGLFLAMMETMVGMGMAGFIWWWINKF